MIKYKSKNQNNYNITYIGNFKSSLSTITDIVYLI